MLSYDDDIIIAQCTPNGKGALALLRLSGNNVRSLVNNNARLASGKNILTVPTHTIHYGRILDDAGNTLDTVMVIVMDAPKTFTGDDVIEITCHNNPFLIDAIITLFIKKGARIAQEGEFTKRAFLHEKIDLVQAEAINELIGATTQAALKKSLAQLEGSFSYWIGALEHHLLRSLAWCEASFEFLDDEAEFGTQIASALNEILAKIDNIKRTFNAQLQIRQGVRIALIGSVNAGKSSLFNALLNQQRAIVTPLAGTTRDAIEAGIQTKENYWTLIDTAGLRITHDFIEQEGIKRSYEEAHKADIILVVFDGSKTPTAQELEVYEVILEKYPSKCILVHHKADLPAASNHPYIQLVATSNENTRFETDSNLANETENSGSASPTANSETPNSPENATQLIITPYMLKVSSLTHANIDELHRMVENKITQLFESMDSPFLLNKRHHALLINLEEKIKIILELLSGSIQYELVSYHLHDALTMLSELTGKSISEAGLDMVFKEFCVGK